MIIWLHDIIAFFQYVFVSLLDLFLSWNYVPTMYTCRQLYHNESFDLRMTAIAPFWQSKHPRIPETLLSRMAESQLEGGVYF